MKLFGLCITIIVILDSHFAVTYRILGFHPTQGKSQQNIFATILHRLASKGHSVVYITPVKPDLSHPNLEVRLMPSCQEKFLALVQPHKLNEVHPARATHMMFSAMEGIADDMYGNSIAQALIHSEEKFDAVTLESAFFQEPVSALLHKFNCPAIEISTLPNVPWLNEIAGLPNNPAYQVSFWTTFTNKLTFWEKVKNFYITWSILFVSYFHLRTQQQIMDQYFNYTGWENRPPIYHLLSNRSVILVNHDAALAYSEPLAPHVKTIGGVNIIPNQPLPEVLEKWMNSASNGVIYFSLGSNLNTSEIMSTEFGESFIKFFKEIPQKVLMKWEKDEIPHGLPSNILFYKWIPQQAVLANKNCQLFITHGGFLSMTEAVYYGVPILGIPFFGDQPSNILFAQNAGYGLSLNKDNITYGSVRWALKELLSNPSYKQEAKRRSQMMKDRAHTGLDEAVYWIEHSIKYSNVLTPPSAHMNFYELHLLDILLFILFSIVIFYSLLKYILFVIKTKLFISSAKVKVN